MALCDEECVAHFCRTVQRLLSGLFAIQGWSCENIDST